MLARFKTVGFVLAAAAALASIPSAAARGERLPECTFNDECPSNLICVARFCRAECRTDRDCVLGTTCSTSSYRCVQPSPPLPPRGFIAGRVETADGRPVRICNVELVYGTPGRASCDARGEFLIGDLQAGRYEVRISGAPDLAPRAVAAYVDWGAHTHVGGVSLSPSLSNVNDGTLQAPTILPTTPKAAKK
jgi:hypothetical protein